MRNYYKPERLSANDNDVWSAMRRSSSAYGQQVRRHIQHLVDFLKCNPQLLQRSTNDIVGLFGAQWIRQGFAPTTLATIRGNLQRFKVDPRYPELALRRVEQFETRNGINRFIQREPPKIVRVLLSEPLQCVTISRPFHPANIDRVAFWALLCVTGGRPNNVLKIRRLRCEPEGVVVHWGTRKVRSGMVERYLYAWSATPPDWVLERWKNLADKPWPFPEPENIAAAVNRWLKDWLGDDTKVKSISPRNTVDVVLRDMVEAGRLSREKYARITDHDYDTGLESYSRAVQQ